MRSARRTRSELGVTLVELMVVVVIIGILVAIGLRSDWRRNDGAAFARKVQSAMFVARRMALSIGVQRYTLPGPFQDRNRVACMPNTRVDIDSSARTDRVEVYACTLRDPPPPGPNAFPCNVGVVDDCDWGTKPVRVHAAPGGYEITRARMTPLDGGGAAVTVQSADGGNDGWADGTVRIYYRPDGSTDVIVPGGGGLGWPNEALEVYVRGRGSDAGAAQAAANTACATDAFRCFKVMSQFHRVATLW